MGDGYCDLGWGCVTGPCNYDQSAAGVSDCDWDCQNIGCDLAKRGDGTCDAACDFEVCGQDFGDCGYCAHGCTQAMLGNGVCEAACDLSECSLDGYDCGFCVDGCFEAMLGDGNCDSECLNVACGNDHGDCNSLACSPDCYPYLINNNVCDSVCNNDACGYDGNDCFCSPGCSPVLQANSDCDAVCATEECHFDGYLCGDCAVGCFNSMIGDGHCDDECYFKACGYDAKDCGCAPGCRTEWAGSGQLPCFVPDCDYDGLFGWEYNQIMAFAWQITSGKLETAFDFSTSCTAIEPACNPQAVFDAFYYYWSCERSCELCAHSFGMCYYGSSPAHCAWSFGPNPGECVICNNINLYSFCVDSCPRNIPIHPISPHICYPAKDISSASSPGLVYVTSTGVGGNIGTWADPYYGLATAFAQNYEAYATIYLLQGTHEFVTVIISSYDATRLGHPEDVLNNGYSNTILVVTTLMCTGTGDHPECASSRATIHIANLAIKISVSSQITFKDVVITGANQLPPGCPDDICAYCPVVETNEEGGLVDDRGKTVTPGTYTDQSECNKYRNAVLFSVKSAGILTLSNVDIVNFRYQPKAIIHINGGSVLLSTVIFSNIIPSFLNGAVILQESCASPPYNCGSLTYTSGTVSYLNNGYEVTENLAVGGFLYADGLKDITFTSVVFEKNIAVNVKEGAMIGLQSFRTLVFDSCVFRNNIATVLISVRAPTLSLARSVDSSNNVIDFGIDHISLKNTIIDKNLASISIISTMHNKDMQNIYIDSCTFTSNVAMKAGLVSLTYAGKVATDMTDGWTKAVALPNGSKVQGYFAPRHVYIENTAFSGNLGDSLFAFSSVANVKIWSTVLFTKNGSSETQNYNDFIVSDFISDSNAYLKMPIGTGEISPCRQILSFQACISLTITGASFTSNLCDSGPAGIVATKTTKALTLNSITFTGNTAINTDGTVLVLTETSLSLSFSNLIFTGNKNTHSAGMGIVYFGPALKVALTACQFSANQASSGAGIYAEDVAQLAISSSTFENNLATSGSAGAVYSTVDSGATQYTLSIQLCTFTSNKSAAAKGGGVFITSDNLTRPYKVVITGSTFTTNIAATSGAALYIESTLVLTADSMVQTCTFTKSTSQKGTIAVYFYSGTLAINECKFVSNTASIGAGIFSTTQAAAILTITSTSFTSNIATGGVIALTDIDIVKTMLTTSCTFQSNKGVSVTVQNGKWTDEKSNFAQNSDSAIRLSDGSIATLTTSIFSGNVASSSGGAAYIASAAVFKCSKCSFTRNSAKDKGGALFLEQSSQIQVSDSSFDSNSCTDKGSAIFILGSTSPVSTVSTSSFTSNSATNSGVISLLSSSLSLLSVTINENIAVGMTPGIVLNLSSLTVKTSTFSNHKGSQGGFLYATTESSAVFTDCSFTNGYAKSGGAFNVIGSTLVINNSKLRSISATSGAGFIAYSQSAITLNQVNIDSMTASDSAIGFISEGTLTVKNCVFSHYSSGGIQADKLTAAYIIESQFLYGAAALGGAFACTRCQTVIIQNCVFAHNSANWGGGVYLTTQSDSAIGNQYMVEFTSFLDNKAWRGGGTYTNNVNIMYNNCTFVGNNASLPEEKSLQSTGDWGRGGGAMADCKDMATCLFNFTRCYIADNHADVSGGGIAWQDVSPNVTNTTFQGNSALYANDISSYAVAIKQMSTTARKLEEILLSGVASGQAATQLLIVALLDHYGNIVTIDNSSSAELTPVDVSTTTVSGVSKVTAVQGLFTFDNYIISAEPGTTAEIRVYTSAIDTSKAEKAKDAVTYSPAISVTAEMRNCTLGESHVGTTCQVCEAGKYSLDPTSTACSTCPDAAICYGNFTMVPRAGYWRARIDTDVFYTCLYAAACTGSPVPPGNLSLTGNCDIGYTGNLCQSCQKGYSRTNKYECGLCPEQNTNIVRLVFIGLAVAILVGIMVSTTIKSAQKTKSLSSIYIKILMNYLQIVILAASFNLSWPKQVLQLFSAQESAGSFTEQAFSVDCFLGTSNSTSNGDVIYNKLVVMAVIPVFLAISSVLTWSFIYIYRRYERFPKDSLAATIVILLFLAHPTLTKYLFNIFTCMEIDGQLYLLQQLDVHCWNYTHVFYIVTCAVPAIIIWVLGVPAVCLGYLVKNKKILQTMSIRIRLGFLFNGYRSQAYYWEFIILYRKIIIICCSVFLTTISIPVQALCVMFILVLALYMQDKVKPYTTADLNAIELKSISCATVTIYCGLFFLTGDLGDSAKLVLFIAIVVTNAFFIWHWALKMFGFYIALVVNKVPCLRRHLGNMYRVKDGLDDDLFIKRRRFGAFSALNEAKDFTPMLSKQSSALNTMEDLYKLRLQAWESREDQAKPEECQGTEWSVLVTTPTNALKPPKNPFLEAIEMANGYSSDRKQHSESVLTEE